MEDSMDGMFFPNEIIIESISFRYLDFTLPK